MPVETVAISVLPNSKARDPQGLFPFSGAVPFETYSAILADICGVYENFSTGTRPLTAAPTVGLTNANMVNTVVNSGNAYPYALQAGTGVTSIPNLITPADYNSSSNQQIYVLLAWHAAALQIEGLAGAGYLGMPAQSATPATPGSGVNVYSDNSGRFNWVGSNGHVQTLDATANTANRTYTFPDVTGAVVLDVATQTLTNKTISTGSTWTGNIVGTAYLGSGSANSTTFLRGDQTWAVPVQSGIYAYTTQNTNFTVTTAQRATLFDVTTSGSNVTMTLPTAATAGAGWYCWVRKYDAGTGLILSSPTTQPAAFALGIQGHMALVWTDGTSWYRRSWFGGEDASGNISITSILAMTLTTASGSNLTLNSATLNSAGNIFTFAGASSLTDNGSGTLTIAAGGSNQSVVLTPTGSGKVNLFGVTVNSSSQITGPASADLQMVAGSGSQYVHLSSTGGKQALIDNGILFGTASVITAAASTDLTLNAGSGNQNVVVNSTGTGIFRFKAGFSATGSATSIMQFTDASSLGIAFDVITGKAILQGTVVGSSANAISLNPLGANVLIGTTTDNSNGILQLASSTSSTAGIAWGSDTTLYRSAANVLTTTAAFNAGAGSFTTLVSTDTTQSTLDTNGAATFAGGVGIVKNLNVGGNATFTGNVNLAGEYLIYGGGSYLTDNGSGTLTIAAGGSNQNVVLTPTGSGKVNLSGNVIASGSLTVGTVAGSNRISMPGDSTNTGDLAMQAGAGSANYGGGLAMFGHSNATYPGWVIAGISSGSGGKFAVNTQGWVGAGTNIFTVDGSGNVIASGSLTTSQTAGIIGTTTNNNASTGSVGEYASATLASGSATSLTSGMAANITSISLTAGDWDVAGIAGFFPAAGTTQSQQIVGISSTSATFPNFDTGGGYSINSSPVAATATSSLCSPTYRFSLASTTIVYLVANATFAVSTLTASGTIRARRVR